MKKLFLFLLVLISIKSFGQTYQVYPQSGKFPRVRVDSVLSLPLGIERTRNISGGQDTGQIRYNKADSSVYIYTGSQWTQITGGGSGVMVTSYGKNTGGDSTILLLSNGVRYAAKDSIGTGGGTADTVITKFPLYTITGGTHDSIAVYGVDSSFQNAARSGDSIIFTRFDGTTKGVYAPTSGGGTVTSFSSGDLLPLFTTSVATSTTTPALSFSLSNVSTNTFFGRAASGTGTPSFIAFSALDSLNNSLWHTEGWYNGRFAPLSSVVTPSALTKTDDTNVTLTLGGSPSVALLAAASLTLGWTGTLSGTRGGTGVNNGSNTITLAGNLVTSGANSLTLTTTGTTNVTLPTTGTLATLAGSETFTNKTLTSPKHTVQALTDGSTITMDMANGDIGTVTLGGNRTLAFSNLASGMFVVIYFTQDGTGGRTITLPASTKVIGGGAGAVTLTTAANAVDVLTFNYVGTTLYCNYGKNYN
jgi:hypothetical protein